RPAGPDQRAAGADKRPVPRRRPSAALAAIGSASPRWGSLSGERPSAAWTAGSRSSEGPQLLQKRGEPKTAAEHPAERIVWPGIRAGIGADLRCRAIVAGALKQLQQR